LLHISTSVFQKHEGIICFKRLSWCYGRGKEERTNNPSLKDPYGSVFTIDGLELDTSAYSCGQLRWAIDHPGYLLLPFHGFFEIKWSTTYGLGGKLSKMGHKLWFAWAI
jgi:hypothetical protein